MWSLLQSHCTLPLITQVETRPQCSLDVGLHGAPVLPFATAHSASAADSSSADSAAAARPPSVSMINQRQRMPWFAAANIACVQAASPQLHPMFFAERQTAPHSAAGAEAPIAAPAVARKIRRAHIAATADAFAEMDPEQSDDDHPLLHTAAASSAHALVAPVDSLSVTDQLAYFQRHVGSKRFACSVSVSTPLEAGGSAERATADDFDAEPLNDVPDELLTQLLQEDAQIKLRERNEDLAQDRLVTLQAHWPDRIARSAAAASSSAAAAASRTVSFALFPTGALMEELALAELHFHSLGSGPLSSPQLSATQLHSTPLDSPIRQICLTAPVPAPPHLRKPSMPAAAVPLIVSRTCQQMYVHTIRFQSNAAAVAGSSDAAAAAAPVASLLALDSHCFPCPIVHMVSSSAIPSEVAFLLQDASIWLWNMQDVHYELLTELQSAPTLAGAEAAAVAIPKATQRRFTVIPASRYWSPSFGRHLLQLPLAWGRILFAPHARSIVLVLPQAVLQIDVRAPYSGGAKASRGKMLPIPALALAHDSVTTALAERAPGPIHPRLHAASISPRCPFHLLLASSDFLMLLDLRSPGSAMIEWKHHQSGEPPTEIEWLDAANGGDGIGCSGDRCSSSAPCAECTERDQFFVTHNRSRNEVTLYHFATRTTQQQEQQQPVTSTFFSRFSPLRLQSIVHAEQRQSADASSGAAVASDLPNLLVGLRLLRDPRVDRRLGLFHVLQLSEYGALVSQSFQHRHDDRSAATNSTVMSVRIPKEVEAELAQQQQKPAAAKKRARDYAEEDDSDIGSERKHAEQSDADSESMPPPSPRMPRGLPLSASKRAALNVLLPAPSTPLSLSRSSSLPLAASPSPHSSPPSLAALLAAPEKYESPWVQKHEIKPHRAVNLTSMLQSLAPETTAAKRELSNSSRTGAGAVPAAPTTFAHLVALLIPALNESHQSVRLFLSLPKTLHELAKFLLDQRIVPAGVLQAIAPEVSSAHKSIAAAAVSSAATLPSREITPRGLHALAQVLSETMHAFLHATHGDEQPMHVPYHRDRWDTLLPSLAAPRLGASSAAIRKRRRKFSGSGGASARSDGDSDAGAESDSSSRRSASVLGPMPLNPFSASFPQPTYNVSHLHLALNRFAEAATEATEGAAATSAACTCGQPSSRATACCCDPLCASFHCMRMHSTLYTLAPSILCTAWPADRIDCSGDADAEPQQLDDGSFPPLPSQPSASSAAAATAAAGVGAGVGGSFLTPAKHASFGAGAGRRATLGPVVDLSQDISFLLSQGTQPIAEEEEDGEPEQQLEPDDKKARDLQHTLSSFMHQQRQPSASIQTLTQSSAEDMPPPEGEEDAAAPANPHGLRDMLCGMGESWRQFSELMHDAAAAQHEQQSTSSSSAAAAAAADSSAALSTRFSDLSDWNASLFRGWLVSHELAVDPAALAAQQAEIGEDMRGATMDLMEDQGGREED